LNSEKFIKVLCAIGEAQYVVLYILFRIPYYRDLFGSGAGETGSGRKGQQWLTFFQKKELRLS